MKSNNYDHVLSKQTIILQLNYIDSESNKKLKNQDAILFEISTKTSSKLNFLEQLKAENQCYQVTTTFVSDNGNSQKALGTSDEINSNILELPGFKLPTLPGYEIDIKNTVDVAITDNGDHWSLFKGQYLWLSSDPNPNENEHAEQGYLKYISKNAEFNIFLKKKNTKSTTTKELKIIEKEPLSRIVKFDSKVTNNDLFSVVDSFNEFENNLFYLCLAQFYNSSNHLLRFSSKQIKELIDYDKHISNESFLKKIDEAFQKYLSIQELVIGKDPETGENYRTRQNLFAVGRVYEQSLKCEIQVNDAFEELFNNLKGWSRFSILDYSRIHSNYSKKLYRLLKAFRTKGIRSFSKDDFIGKLNIPKGYNVPNINQRILKTSMMDLAPYFAHLSVKKNRKNGSRAITCWTFSWDAEHNDQPAIDPNRILNETKAIYNIKNNHCLKQDQKFEAVDRYRGYKIGTTKKAYEHAHPKTYFFDSKTSNDDSDFVRPNLRQVYGISLKDLVDIIRSYEDYNRRGTLEAGDIDDLILLEKIYAKRQLKVALKTATSDKPNLPNSTIIAGKLIKKDFKFKDSLRLIADQAEIDTGLPRLNEKIESKVRKEWSEYIRTSDHRPPELK